jgi:hypothetical protein
LQLELLLRSSYSPEGQLIIFNPAGPGFPKYRHRLGVKSQEASQKSIGLRHFGGVLRFEEVERDVIAVSLQRSGAHIKACRHVPVRRASKQGVVNGRPVSMAAN